MRSVLSVKIFEPPKNPWLGVKIFKHPKKFFLVVFKGIGNPKKITKGVEIFELLMIMMVIMKKKMLTMMMFMITLGDYVVEEEDERSWFQIGEGFEAQIAWKKVP